MESDGIKPDPKRPWFDPACAVLMAVSSLLTAWCSYQNSCWSGVGAAFETEADKLDRHGIAMRLEAGQVQEEHMQLWMEAVDAHIDGDLKLEQFHTERFREELKPAYEKWLAHKPFENPGAPPNPFADGIYLPRFKKEIREAHAEAARLEAESAAAGKRASGYLGHTVLLATVLFFAGTAGRFDKHQVRWSALSFAVILFLFSAVRIWMLPVA